MTPKPPRGWRPLPGTGRGEPRRIGDGLDALAKRLGVPSADALGGVFSRWDDIVGPSIAAHARPVSLRDQVLHVQVDEPGWATQIRFLGTDLVARIAAAVGEGVVASVDVRVGRPRGGAKPPANGRS